jgi:hypothetical protein
MTPHLEEDPARNQGKEGEANRFFFQLSGKKSAQQPKTMGEMPTPPKISEGCGRR